MTDRIDEAIDRAVREMLDVEPRADLRARVIDRIDQQARVASGFPPAHVASAFRRKILISAPLAAAAVLVLAVWGPWRQAPIVMVPAPPPSIARVEPRPDVTLPAPPRPATLALPYTTRRAGVDRPGIQRTVTAAVVADDAPVEGFPRVPSLNVPELVVPDIRAVASVAQPTQLGVEPIAAPAPIEIEPLPTTPRERQEQE